MNIKPTQTKLKQLLLCVSALNISAFAAYREVTGGGIITESNRSYASDATHRALHVSDPGSQYNGTNITLNAPLSTSNAQS